MDTISPRPYFKEKMIELAQKLILERKRKLLIGNQEAQVLFSVAAYLNEKEKNKEESSEQCKNPTPLIPAYKLRDFIREVWDIPALRTEAVTRTLNKYKIVMGQPERHRVPGRNQNSEKRILTCLRIDRQKLEEVTEPFRNGGE